MRGAEERDLTLGRLFGLAAISRYASPHGSAAAANAAAAAAAPAADEEADGSAAASASRAAPARDVAAQVLALLLEVFARRRWAREATVSAVRDLLRRAPPRDVAEALLPLVAAALGSGAAAAGKGGEHGSPDGTKALGLLSPDHLALALCAEEALRRCAKALDADDDESEDESEGGEEGEDDERAAAAGVPSHGQVAAAASLFWPILRPPGFVLGSAAAAAEAGSKRDQANNSGEDENSNEEEDDDDDDDGEEEDSMVAGVDGAAFAEFEAEVAAEGVPRVLRPGTAADALAAPLRLGSAAFPRLHLSWELVLDGLLANPEAGDEEAGEEAEAATFPPQSLAAVQCLWGGAAGAALLSGTHQMKGTALALLPRVAQRLPADHVGSVALTPALVKLLLNSTVREMQQHKTPRTHVRTIQDHYTDVFEEVLLTGAPEPFFVSSFVSCLYAIVAVAAGLRFVSRGPRPRKTTCSAAKPAPRSTRSRRAGPTTRRGGWRARPRSSCATTKLRPLTSTPEPAPTR
jgi:hypothetical protein